MLGRNEPMSQIQTVRPSLGIAASQLRQHFWYVRFHSLTRLIVLTAHHDETVTRLVHVAIHECRRYLVVKIGPLLSSRIQFRSQASQLRLRVDANGLQIMD